MIELKIVDARGLECPKPVIETKKALDGNIDQLTTIVDNKTAVENVRKLVTKLGYEYEVLEKGEDFEIIITQGDSVETNVTEHSSQGKFKDLTILFSKNTLGEGNDALGEILMKGYIYTLTEMDQYPKKLLFVNSGVYLTLDDSESLEDLKILASAGVEILSCGTCLDYLDVKDRLAVGEVSNMYSIVEGTTTVDEKTIVL